MIEDFDPQVGHAHFIEIGKGQGHMQPDVLKRLVSRKEFLSQIAAGFLDLGKEVRQRA